MNDKLHNASAELAGASALVASVAENNFGSQVLHFVSSVAPIGNFGAFYFADLSRPNPVLSISAGRMSQYIFHRDAAEILSDPVLQTDIVAQIKTSSKTGLIIERWHPSEDDPRLPLYQRSHVLERISVSSRLGRGGLRSFFLRDLSAGWLSDVEYKTLFDILPFVHELIGLRHRVVGAENFQFSAQHNVSSLRERNVAGFMKLSQREADCCDCLIAGMTVSGTALEMGVAETTVRTLRRRAYRKMGVTSATQLMALLINDAAP